jgi:hypothetical protein
MNRNQITSHVAKLLKKGEYIFRIKKYLATHEITDDEEIRDIIYDAKLSYLPSQKTTTWTILAFSFVILSYLFYFVFARAIAPELRIIYAGVVAAVLSIMLYFIFVLYKSWEINREDKYVTPGPSLDGLAFMLVPAVLIFLLFKSRVNDMQDLILLEDYEYAQGTVIDGSSVRVSVAEHTFIKVRFRTKDNKIVRVSENISQFDFNDFYEDQKIPLIYSAKDYHNIMLLTSPEVYRKHNIPYDEYWNE